MRRVRAWFALLLLTSCVTPEYEDCTLACGAGKRCPDGLVCDSANLCRLEAEATECPGVTPPAIDATPSTSDAALPGGPGDVCHSATECAPPHTCVAAPVDGICEQTCKKGPDCQNGDKCVDATRIDGGKVKVCRPDDDDD
jgi:hypothetical protein